MFEIMFEIMFQNNENNNRNNNNNDNDNDNDNNNDNNNDNDNDNDNDNENNSNDNDNDNDNNKNIILNNFEKNLENIFVQLNFQCVRIQNEEDFDKIRNVFINLLHYLFDDVVEYSKECNIECNTSSTDTQRKGLSFNQKKLNKSFHLLILLYRFIAYNRDILQGKGERKLSYMFIFELYQFYPELSKFAILSFVKGFSYNSTYNKLVENNSHPFGSFKDIKYLCHYIYTIHKDVNHPLIQYCISILNKELKQDIHLILHTKNYDNPDDTPDDKEDTNKEEENIHISLVSKWIPREKSSKKFNWMFVELSKIAFPVYNTQDGSINMNKSKMFLRKYISILNNYIDTIQIHQCSHNWKHIKPNHITSITFQKQKK